MLHWLRRVTAGLRTPPARPTRLRRPRAEARLALLALEHRIVPAAPFFAVGAPAGAAPTVTVYDGTGNQLQSISAYAPGFTGGVRVATATVQGIPEVITAPGSGGGPQVNVFNALTGQQLESFYAYDPTFTGGVSVAVGDVNGDGTPDIITGAGRGGGPEIKAFSGVDTSVLLDFYAFSPNFTGGVSVSTVPAPGGGHANVVVGAGAGGGPEVAVFGGLDGSQLSAWYAYNPAYTDGVNVATVMINGQPAVVTGTNSGGGPEVAVFDTTGSLIERYDAFAPNSSAGVQVGSLQGSAGDSQILASSTQNGSPVFSATDPRTMTVDTNINPPAGGFVSVGQGDLVAPNVGIRAVDGPDTSPALSGTVDDPAATIQVTVDGQSYPAVNNRDGTWSLAEGTLRPLTGGGHAVSVTATNHAGLTGAAAAGLTVTRPTVGVSDVTTGDPSPAVTGTIDDPAAAVSVNVDGGDYDATNNGDGTWTLDGGMISPLTPGSYTVVVTATNSFGTPATARATLTVTPTAPAVGVSDLSTPDTSPELTGTTDDPAATISVALNGANYRATNNGDGTWTVAQGTAAALAPGAYPVVVTAINTFGLTSTASATLTVTAPVVSVDPLATADPSPQLSGTIDDPAATISVAVNGADYQATNNGDGSWTLAQGTVTALPQGTYIVVATATNDFGTVSTGQAMLVVATRAPGSAVTAPADGANFTAATWPGAISGTAVDNGGAGLAAVGVSVQDLTTNKYWDGSGFNRTTPTFVTATGTTNWTLVFNSSGFPTLPGSYLVNSRATDTVGNIETPGSGITINLS